jgi:hypothetical protein
MVDNDIDVGFLIKDAFKSIRKDFDYVYLFFLPLTVYIIAMIHVWFVIGDIFSIMQNNAQNPYVFFSLIQNNFITLLIMGIFYAIIFAILYSVAMAGVVKKFDLQEKNTHIHLSEVISFGFNKLPRIFGATLLTYLIVLGPFFALFFLAFWGITNSLYALAGLSVLLLIIVAFVAIYVYLRLLLYLQTCIIEDLGVVECIKRSWVITKGNALLIFITALILGIIAIAVSVPFIIAGNAGVPYAQSIGNFIAFGFIGPIQTITYTILYFKLTRKPQTHQNPQTVVQPPNYPQQ